MGTATVTVSAFNVDDPSALNAYQVGSNNNLVYACLASGKTVTVDVNTPPSSPKSLASILSAGGNLGTCTTKDDELAEAPGLGHLAPEAGLLVKAFPNPFTNTVNINLNIEYDSEVRVDVFTMDGKRIVRLLEAPMVSGQSTQLQFHAEALPPGMYLYRVATSKAVKTGKLTLIR